MSDISVTLYAIWQKNDLSKLMRNVHAHLISYDIANQQLVNQKLVNQKLVNQKFVDQKPSTIIPATVIDKVDKTQPNCFVISPFANLVSYATAELHKLPPLYRYTSQGLINSIAAVLNYADIDKVQVLANCLMATNAVSNTLLHSDITDLTVQATQNLPEHTLIIRSLNLKQHQQFIDTLQRLGWLAVANRQVYIIDNWEVAQKRRDYKRDLKLLQDDKFRFEALIANGDADFNNNYFNNNDNNEKFEIAEKLYNELYLDKYTHENVQFTALYMQKMVAEGVLSLHLLWDNVVAQYVGMVATIVQDDVMIIPMVGYDLQQSQSKALYRRLMMFAINKAHQGGYVLHLSAGAPQFKRHRGAEPSIEYMMVYVEHLPSLNKKLLIKKGIWRSLSMLSKRYYVPLLQRMQL